MHRAGNPVHENRAVAFVFNLLQDVNVLRPLVYLVAREIGLPCVLLVSHLFRQRDTSGLWQQELLELAQDNWARIVDFHDLPSGLHALDGMTGYLVAGSESDLSAHKPVHDLFRAAPPGLRKITLQHGFECVGFLQSRDQDLAHGTSIGFAAEIICGWADPVRLRSVAPSQRHKLFVTGPSFLLHPLSAAVVKNSSRTGLVCENMHSPRLNVAGNVKHDFLEVFTSFCQSLEHSGESVSLRPHPGGQYFLKQGLAVPSNVSLSNQPMYRTNLSHYAYGISAPSSVLLDMVLAGIPTAVWQDDSSLLDLGNYEGLTRISGLKDWLAFKEKALAEPEALIANQNSFLERQRLLLNPEEISYRFRSLLSWTGGSGKKEKVPKHQQRILFIANAKIPTLQLGFLKPLAGQQESGDIGIEILTEPELRKLKDDREVVSKVKGTRPDLIVFCRYSGPNGAAILAAAKALSIPTVYHIDDDLLHIPPELGEKKHVYHSAPERVSQVRHLLDHVTLIYCSTEKLLTRLRQLGIRTPAFAGKIYCAADVIRRPEIRPVTKVGYMAIVDNTHNLDPIMNS